MKNKIPQNTQKVYNNIAKHFAQTRAFNWHDIKPLKQYACKGDKVLDLACGAGRLYQLFMGLGIDYVGVDNSQGQIEQAKIKYPETKFMVADMLDLPFSDSEFDALYCIAALHHLPDEKSRLKALREANRVLKPNGTLVMSNWNLDSDWAQKKVAKGDYGKLNERDYLIPWKNPDGEFMGERYYHSFLPSELTGLLKNSGFKLKKQYYSKSVKWTDDKKGPNLITIAVKV